MNKFAFQFGLAVCLLSSSVLSPCAAQPSPAASPPASPAASPERRGQLQEALQQVGLTEQQKLQIQQIIQAGRASGQDRNVTREKIQAVLTAEQKAKLKVLLSERKAFSP